MYSGYEEYNNPTYYDTKTEKNTGANIAMTYLIVIVTICFIILLVLLIWAIFLYMTYKNRDTTDPRIPQTYIQAKGKTRKRVHFNERIHSREFSRDEPPSKVEKASKPNFINKLSEEKTEKSIEYGLYGDPCDDIECNSGLVCSPSSIYYIPDGSTSIKPDFEGVRIHPLNIDIITKLNKSIKDVAHYDRTLIILLSDGNFVKYNENLEIYVDSNIVIEEIAVHNNMIYGLAKGEIYSINSKMISKETWEWNKVKNWTDNVISIEASTDGSEMFLKTQKYGYIVKDGRITDKRTLDENTYKIYGCTPTNHVYLNGKGQAKVMPADITINDVSSGILTKSNKFLYLHEDHALNIQRIRQIENEPVFISRAICVNSNGEKPIIKL